MTKAADNAMDRIWSAFEQRLGANLEISGDEGASAARIHPILFPKGMGFWGFKYAEQGAEGEAILGRIASEKLEPSLDKLVGPGFLKVVRERHGAYGEALAGSPSPGRPSRTSRASSSQCALRRAVDVRARGGGGRRER